ncbi:MAG: DUF547 domain-containing protein [Deltaproteobacteria bacterium]|nr:DUF547 domain-containing protein [Deltaproteobacteria bacterium]
MRYVPSRMWTRTLSVVLCFWVTSARAAPPTQSADGPRARPDHALSEYARLLSTYVDAKGRVDYKGLAAKDLEALHLVIDWFAGAEAPFENSQKVGFYVDAYNASVLNAVIRFGRPRSVLDVRGFFSSIKHKVAGQSLTLDQLEKEVLKPIANDPRTHFILVCGAVGCPILEAQPYSGSDIEARMENATRRYLQGPTGAIPGPNSIRLSKIFDWYSKDFGNSTQLVSFVRARLLPSAQAVLGPSPTIDFIDYNWTLNQQ